MAAAAAAGLWFLLAACGSPSSQVRASAPTVATAATKTVTFGSAAFDVPAAWPVYDLTATPHRCARFDVHAVYLGHQAADAACPARALGKTEAVQVEADDASAQAHVLPSAASATVNGQAVAYEPGGPAENQIVATFSGLGVVVRATYSADPGTARQIVATVRKAGA